jgi:hypothetical protein
MAKNLCHGLPAGLVTLALAVGFAANSRAGGAGYFDTPFQSESQFIVEAIVSDLAEQMYFARNGQLPEKK